MKIRLEARGDGLEADVIVNLAPNYCLLPLASRLRSAFTLIEIMLVVALMGIICATAVPNIYQLSKKEGMRRAVQDLKDVCDNARAKAIFTAHEVSVVFYPAERTFYISGNDGPAFDPVSGETKPAPPTKPGTGTTGIIPEDITIQMLDINRHECRELEWAKVKFFANGTCEELVINYRDSHGQDKWIKLDPATGMVIVGERP